ncbi:MAG TPA: carboxypeptidase-like regulatory domain-containing protein [Puia sp.]|nr:carboxypeptidase-like regulatory domain-containing protein [Puia sp.]
MNKIITTIFLPLILVFLLDGCGSRNGLDGFTYTPDFHPSENAVRSDFTFDGYTYYWHGISQEWTRYGNLFKTNASGAVNAIIRSKFDVAADMGLEGLSMQEGFLDGLLKEPFATLKAPSAEDLEKALKDSNVLVLTSPGSELGRQLTRKYVPDSTLQSLIEGNIAEKSRVSAFTLENGSRKLFVISAADSGLAEKTRQLAENVAVMLKSYDLRRGWFGAQTLINSVTNTPGHPLEVIGKGMNEGNSWFVFSGYMEFLSKGQYRHWMEKAHLPVVTDVGFATGRAPIFGCRDYDSLQVQSLFTHSAWVNYAHSKGGYAFRAVYDTTADTTHLNFDGYMAIEGNKEQIDQEGKPFVSVTGPLESGAIPCMVLFAKKGEPFTQKTMWQTILEGREVAVLEKGLMMGPAPYRNTLEMLLLDRVFLDEYYGDKVNLEAKTTGYDLQVKIKNAYTHGISGKLSIVMPTEMGMDGDSVSTLDMAAGSERTLTFRLHPTKDAMDSTTPIAIHYSWGSSEKSTVTMLELPPAISVHRLLYGQAPQVKYPVTIHNFTADTSFPVTVQVLDSNAGGKVVFETKQNCSAATGTFRDLTFDLQTPPGNYTVKVSALGVENISQLGVRNPAGRATLREEDLNHDGINEYVMENDSVKATLLTTGARIIEYIVKSKNDNVLFKLWPDKPVDDKRPSRKREFYPYGGFEDFLGQPSIETSTNYDAVVTKKEGDYVQVKMTADYYGNKLEKIFTLFGNSPLVEIRYALTFKNPELNMIGPQPMVALGKSHGPEDRFVFPEEGGMRYCTADLKKYFGRVIFLKEGWNAAYDTKENISFVGAFPVDQPIFLHMWMNHPSNPGSMYFYAELQPWIRIFQKSTMYFSYYLWAEPGSWEHGVKALRDRDLITTRKTWPFLK